MSRFTTLAHGAPLAVVEELRGDMYANNIELCATLINALLRIDALETQVANLRKELAE